MTMPDLSPRGGGEAEARAVLRSHGCCMEDYGAMGEPGVIENGRAEYDRLLDTYRSAVRAAYREEVMAMVTSMKSNPKHCGRLFADGIEGWNAALDTLASRLDTPTTEDG